MLIFSITNFGVSILQKGNILAIKVSCANFAANKKPITKMKRLLIMAVGVLALTACTQQKKDATEAGTADLATTDTVAAGHFDVREFDGYKLHIYLTEDIMGDASFIIEGRDSLVTLEQPLFKVNAQAFDKYLASLNKPVAGRIADFHLGNTGDAPIIMPEGMADVVKGEAYSGMMNHFADEYGDAIVPMPTGTVTELAFNTPTTLAGIQFTLYNGAENDFPGANILIGKDVVYSHWAPEKAHINNLYAGNIESVDSRIAELEKIAATGATVFVGGHGAPATAEDVKFRIDYLNKIKELRASRPDAEKFATALTDAYPGLAGADAVKGLADALYSEK